MLDKPYIYIYDEKNIIGYQCLRFGRSAIPAKHVLFYADGYIVNTLYKGIVDISNVNDTITTPAFHLFRI